MKITSTNVMTIQKVKKRNVSILLMTAAKVEEDALLKEMTPLENESGIVTAVGKTQHYNVGMLGKYAVVHVHCTDQGSLREGGVIATAFEAIKEIEPKVCVMVGIAYGADENRQQIGDVLISEKIQSYNVVRISTDKNGEIRKEDRNIIRSPGRIISTQFLNFDFVDREYNIHRGTILSGEELIDNKKYKESLIERFSQSGKTKENIIGGEMEGFGLSSAFARYGNENWIVVKGICDWADGNKSISKRERQEKAASNAVDFCKHIFSTEMLCQIDGIRMLKQKKEKDIINGQVLFYYRNMYTMGIRQLSEQTKIPEETLREYEKTKMKNGMPIWSKIPIKQIGKLNEVLKIGNAISYERTPLVISSFYEKNYGKGKFYPIKNAKVVIFDFDGTLINVENNYSVWQLIWIYLGYSLDDCARFQRKYSNNQLTHQEWCNKTEEYFKKKNLTSEDVENVAKQIKLIDGAIETLEILKTKGIKLYICSGAIKDIIETVIGEHYLLFDGIVCNEFSYDRKGKLSHIEGTKYDFERKPEYIKKIIRENGILPEECLFIGNSDNDIHAYKSGANTLVVNPHKTDGMDRKVWKYYLGEINNLHEILPFIFPEAEDDAVTDD